MDSNSSLLKRASSTESAKQKFLTGVYGWMAIALLISGVTAYLTATSEPILRFVFGGRYNFIIIAVIEIALVWWLSASIRKISVGAAAIGFIAYSVINGVTMASIFFVYTAGSIASVFVVTAAMFGLMAVYGMTTKSNLNTAGRYLSMALIGILIASLVNFFLHSEGIYWLISIVTVVVFTGLTAYDSQKMLAVANRADGSDMFRKAAIIGALELYLDFINMFLALLRLFGRRNN